MSTHIRKLLFWNRTPPFARGQVVLITGAASGIGHQLALIYARRQCKLVLCDLNQSTLDTVAEQCQSLGSQALAIRCDVTDAQAVRQMIQRTLAHYNSGLDLLVLCAGLGAHHLFARTPDVSIYERLMRVNFYGYVHCVHAAYEALCASPRGQVLAITSFSGEVGLPYRTAYCASKFAVTGFLEALRSEMAVVEEQQTTNRDTSAKKHSFDITIVCPPTIDTNLRKNALTPDASLQEAAPSPSALSVEQCAAAIVDAADRRLRKAFFPFQSWFASYARPLMPDLMDRFIMKRAKL